MSSCTTVLCTRNASSPLPILIPSSSLNFYSSRKATVARTVSARYRALLRVEATIWDLILSKCTHLTNHDEHLTTPPIDPRRPRLATLGWPQSRHAARAVVSRPTSGIGCRHAALRRYGGATTAHSWHSRSFKLKQHAHAHASPLSSRSHYSTAPVPFVCSTFSIGEADRSLWSSSNRTNPNSHCAVATRILRWLNTVAVDAHHSFGGPRPGTSDISSREASSA